MDEIRDLVRKAIREVLDCEATSIGDGAGARDPIRVERKESLDFLFALEVGFGVGQELAPGLVERLAFANAMQDVVDWLVRTFREEDTVRRAKRDTMRAARIDRTRDAHAIFAVF